MVSLYRIWQMALWEWGCAIRSRRALVVVAIYLVCAVLCMNGSVSVLSKMEAELTEVLQLPAADSTGVVSKALWNSKPFARLVRAVVGGGPVLDDIFGRHPVELLYAWFAFLCTPLLAMLVSATRVSDDLRSGAVRYMMVRMSRLEWALGKYVGQTMMVLAAMAVSSLGAAAVAFFLLSPGTAASLVWPMLGWGARAWLYSLSWIGIALGVSHLTRSPGRASAIGVFAVCVFGVIGASLGTLQAKFGWPEAVLHLEGLLPSSSQPALWRFSWQPVAAGTFHLLVLGLSYLMAGVAIMMRKDV